jgi:translation initiation factor IF-2
MVAMTKIDKPGISVDESRYRIESELLDHGIITESFAGTTDSKFGPPVQLVPVSGITGDGLDELIESLVLQSEVMELRADQNARAEGIIMDARVEKGIGVVVDCIVRWGSMERGDIVLSGIHMGKVKALKDGEHSTVFLL